MFGDNPDLMKLLALGAAKVSFGCLNAVNQHLEGDLQLGLVGFASVLRTRRDWFPFVEQNGINDAVVQELKAHPTYSTSIYELSNYIGMDRATVRRKLNKLAELGIMERDQDQRWHLVDFPTDGSVSRGFLLVRDLLALYLDVMSHLEALAPEEIGAIKQKLLSNPGAFSPAALNEQEMQAKEKKGYLVGTSPPDTGEKD